MKYIAASLVIALCTLTGYKFGNNLSLKTQELSAILYFLRFYENELVYLQASVSTIIEDFVKENNSLKMDFIKKCSALCREKDFPEAWSSGISNSNIHIDDSSKQLLLDFGKKIGTSDTETQLKYINYYTNAFEKVLENAERQEKENKKLYILTGFTIGLIGGIMIV